MKKSRNGCLRCKQLKRKCDEEKPACERCVKAGAACEYKKVLTWGNGVASRGIHKGATFISDVGSRAHVEAAVRNFRVDIESSPSSMSTPSSDGGAGSGTCMAHGGLELLPVSSIPGFADQISSILTHMEQPTHMPVINPVNEQGGRIQSLSADAYPPGFLLDLEDSLPKEDYILLRKFFYEDHWRLVAHNRNDGPLKRYIVPLVSKSPALAEVIIVFEALCTGQSYEASLRRFGGAIELFLKELSPEKPPETAFAVGVFICLFSLSVGYKWTSHIQLLYSLVEAKPATIFSGDFHSDIIANLGVFDLDNFIAGRTSPRLNIWLKYCMGRSGFDPITGLPYSMIDMIAKASDGQNIMHELLTFRRPLQEVRPEPLPTSTPGPAHIVSLVQMPFCEASMHVWEAYRHALMLYVYMFNGGHVDNLAATCEDAYMHSDAVFNCSGELPLFLCIWPLFMVGLMTDSLTLRQRIARQFERLISPLNYLPIRMAHKLMLEFWKRKETQPNVSYHDIAREWNMEVCLF
ncbi:YALI0C19063p [Yarrowia lipolytica CLIB122]|uniref:YALI0C19063p n=3 Tax=Yarrowia lipolytica TaxID=4952 RepID=Q6CBG5_YARLI|nr:YALI0C19063p [Yarrowia lipolytica CLIB122]KAJ8053613.1 hypothetical protein LXG23DRAFT_55196 [Yarrowia lipolytica]QNP95920.1 C6 finger domain transcription factor nosA [Yarrowia lipolytica]CAG82317.1 YALI0C19063p [Yarrowia lipolytica CLIB122]SEI33914.1 YALIA101S04e05490g1_1 [Yarrowia lipolytica]VBB89212.1 Conserved hypothetical protein [Yarrowia lipolytica]|eukprot:XP_501997.1 YALI0C19063p [Yarrowia lipolytica CLIB122]